jgi:hypothetical protein
MRILPHAPTFGVSQLSPEVRPEARATKLPQVVVNRLPRWNIAWEIAPGTPRAQEVEDRVEDGAEAVAAEFPTWGSGWEELLETVPLGIRKAAWIIGTHGG